MMSERWRARMARVFEQPRRAALTRSWKFTIGFACVLAAVAACSPAAGGPAIESDEACPEENLTAPCTCDGLPGRQVCIEGAWSSCECAAAIAIDVPQTGGAGGGGGNPTSIAPTFAGNLRTDIIFEWQSTAPPVNDGTCLPGRYEGNLQGWYWSILEPFQVGVPIANFELPGGPSGFFFDLLPAQGGETIQKVVGEVNGVADLVFPFTALIDGELNCRTGVLTGSLLDGNYSILAEGFLPQSFEGVFSAFYDKRTHTFVDGVWDVRETTAIPAGTLAPALPRVFSRDGYGGFGDFAAGFPTDLTDPALTACPSGLTCGPGPLGPNKKLCNGLLGVPTCVSDADCNLSFPGENVPCLDAALFSICVRECKP